MNKEFHSQKKPTNPILLKVFEQMTERGDLKGLSDDDALEKVLDATEEIIANAGRINKPQ